MGELPGNYCVEITRQGFQDNNKEERTENRSLVNTNRNLKLFAQLAVHTHLTSGIRIHALNSTNCPFFHSQLSKSPPEHRSGNPIKSFFKVHKAKIERLFDSSPC